MDNTSDNQTSEREVGTKGKLLLLAKEDGLVDGMDVYNRKKVYSCFVINTTVKCLCSQCDLLRSKFLVIYVLINNCSKRLFLFQHYLNNSSRTSNFLYKQCPFIFTQFWGLMCVVVFSVLEDYCWCFEFIFFIYYENLACRL